MPAQLAPWFIVAVMVTAALASLMTVHASRTPPDELNQLAPPAVAVML
ncbi:hypothetical protein [Mycobacterium avium]|nr:hypothetical protein [Mycobacterium avium]